MTDQNISVGEVVTVPQAWTALSLREPKRVVYRHKRRGVWTGLRVCDLMADAKAIGLALQDFGLSRGSVVSILSDNRPEWVVVDLAAQSMGYISHAIYPTVSEHDLGHALRAAGTIAILVEDVTQLAKVLAVRDRCLSLRLILLIERKGLGKFSDPLLRDFPEFLAHGCSLIGGNGILFDSNVTDGRADDIACLLPTAGAANASRLSAASQGSLMQAAMNLPTWLKTRRGDRSLSVMSLANAAERSLSLLAPLVTPIQVHFPENAATVLNDLRDVSPHIINALPRFWSYLKNRTEGAVQGSASTAVGFYQRAITAEKPGAISLLILRNLRKSLGLANLRVAISGYAPLNVGLQQWYEHLGTPLANGYGVTEAGGYVWVDMPVCEGVECATGEIAGIELKLSSNNEIMVSGAMLHSGYWDAQRTKRLDTYQGSLATNDQASALGTARLRLTGRSEDRLKLRNNVTIDISVFKRTVLQHEEILDLIVFGDGLAFLTAVVALDAQAAGQYAKRNNISYTDHASLVSSPGILNLVASHFEAANRLMPEGGKVQQFRILSTLLDGLSEELSPALRLKRSVVGEKYSNLIEDMYRQSA